MHPASIRGTPVTAKAASTRRKPMALTLNGSPPNHPNRCIVFEHSRGLLDNWKASRNSVHVPPGFDGKCLSGERPASHLNIGNVSAAGRGAYSFGTAEESP